MDNSTQENNELLMRYLDGEMTAAEREDFEKKLATDTALQTELENIQVAKAAVKFFGLKQKVAAIHQSIMEEAKHHPPVIEINRRRLIVRYTVAVAASILLLFVGYWVYTFYTLSPNKLYADNYFTYELTTSRDSGSSQESGIEKAYREKKYDEVIRLNAVSVVSAKDIFLTGLSYLEKGDPSRAISSFQVVLTDADKTKPSALKDETEYYLALAYLKNRDYDQSIELMIQIHDSPDHIYKDKISGKLIRKVKMLKWR